jgi:cobalamin biosynthesis protein CobT
MRNTNHLIGSLPIVAQALGDKLGVRVEIGGDQAATDGSTIWIPALPPDDEAAVILARGFIDHEAGHIRFTKGTMTGTPLEQSLQNILEDVRIERAMTERYPGAGQNLKRLVERLVADGRFSPVPAEAHPGTVVCGYLLHKLRSAILGQTALESLADQAEEVFSNTFSPGAATRIAAIGFEVHCARSTDDVRDLARRILQSLEEDDQDDPPEPRGDEGDAHAGTGADRNAGGDENQPDDADGNSGGDSNEDAGGESGSESEGDAGDSSEDPDGAADGSPGGNAGGEQEDDPQEPGKSAGSSGAAKQALSATDEDLSGHDLGEILSQSLEDAASEDHSPGSVTVANDRPGRLMRSSGMLDAEQSRIATVGLRARLDGLMQSRRLERSRPTRSGGRIDNRKLHRIAVGDTRVFAARNERVAPNTAVSLLLDRSYSMHGETQKIANEAVYAAALALSGLPGGALHTAAFPVGERDMATITPFGGRVEAKDYAIVSSGGTPLAEALWRTAIILSGRPEPRRICVVATDGDPNDGKAVSDVVGRMESAGIELFALGIRTTAPAQFFRNTEVITDVAEMPKALLGMLQGALLSVA